MPSLVPDPDLALLATIRELKARVGALENRRTNGLPRLLTKSNTFQTFPASTDTVLDLASVDLDTHGVLDTGTSVVTVPFAGTYQMVLYLPMVNTPRSTNVKLQNGTGSVTHDALIIATQDSSQPAFVMTWPSAAGDTLRFTLNPALGSMVVTEVAKLDLSLVRPG